MSVQENSFRQFWSEVGNSFLYASLKSIILLIPAIFVASLVLVIFACLNSSDIRNDSNCSMLMSPKELFHTTGYALPHLFKIIFAGAPPILLGVLYLEWDRYKKDEASWFTHGKGCEGPPGYSRRLKLMQGTALSMGGKVYEAAVIDENHKRYAGVFSEEELLRYVRRQYARSENKPLHDSPERLDWAIRQNNGTEVHIELRRLEKTPTQWVMVTRFYEWAGRRQPPRLAQTHTTEFVLQANGEAKPSI